jgi:hypothetical protein
MRLRAEIDELLRGRRLRTGEERLEAEGSS